MPPFSARLSFSSALVCPPFLKKCCRSSVNHARELEHSKCKQSGHEQQIASQRKQTNAHSPCDPQWPEVFGVNLLFRLIVERMHDGKEPTLLLCHFIEFSRQGHFHFS